jgi:hypothetical protein
MKSIISKSSYVSTGFLELFSLVLRIRWLVLMIRSNALLHLAGRLGWGAANRQVWWLILHSPDYPGADSAFV